MRLWDFGHSHLLQSLNVIFLPSKLSSGKAAIWGCANNWQGRKGINN